MLINSVALRWELEAQVLYQTGSQATTSPIIQRWHFILFGLLTITTTANLFHFDPASNLSSTLFSMLNPKCSDNVDGTETGGDTKQWARCQNRKGFFASLSWLDDFVITKRLERCFFNIMLDDVKVTGVWNSFPCSSIHLREFFQLQSSCVIV